MSATREQFLDDVAAILDRKGHFGSATLSVAREEVVGDVQRLLARLAPEAEGWICTGSAIYLRRGGVWTHVSGTASDTPDFTEVLSGEFAVDARSSLHLRRIGGSLVAFRYAEVGEAPVREGASAVPVVTEDTKLVSTEAGLHLCYRTYRKQAHSGVTGCMVTTWEPWLSRFTGFRSRNEVSA